jgi:hypothetical protein
MAGTVASYLRWKRRERKIQQSGSQSSESDFEAEKKVKVKQRPNIIETTDRGSSAREGIKQRNGQFINSSTWEITKIRTPSPKRAISFAENLEARPRPPERTKTGDERLDDMKLQSPDTDSAEGIEMNEMSTAGREKREGSFWERFRSNGKERAVIQSDRV